MLDLSRRSCLGEALHDAAIAYQGNMALYEANRRREAGRCTFREARIEAERVGARLQEEGVEPGDRVAVLMSNQSRWTLSALGAFWAGAVLVPLDYKLSAPEQAALLRHARPRALFVEWPLWRRLLASEAPLPEGLRVFVSEAPEGSDLGAAGIWEAPAEHALERQTRRREDTCCVVYSSGTGGRPKGCMLSHGAYLHQAQVLGRLFPLREHHRYFSILPTNHAIDFMCGLVIPWLFGAAVVHQRALRPDLLAWTLRHYRVSHMALVPRILGALREGIEEKLRGLPPWKRLLLDGLSAANDMATLDRPRPALSRALLRSVHEAFGGRLELMFCGGAFVDPELARFFYRLGLPVVIGYGLTEACTVATVNDLSPFRADTVGRPVEGVEVEVRGGDASGVGEVWLRGPTVMQGYLDDPEATTEALQGGWLRTGDLGLLDPAGHLRLVGRAKNMVVTAGGKNVYPEDVEAAFEGLHGCREHCVMASGYLWPGVPLDEEELVIMLRPKGADVTLELLEDLRARNRRLPAHKRCSGYLVWERDFPRTASLKVRRHELARAVAESLPRSEGLRSLA